MKKFYFKSIYIKFSLVFLSIWWMYTFLVMGIIKFIMRRVVLGNLVEPSTEEFYQFHMAIQNAGVLFDIALVLTGLLGTIGILIALRSIVNPIKIISKASKEVASGNFEVSVEVKGKDEMSQLASDFNLMVKGLKSIEILQSDFVSSVSHEFKTPITSIKGFAKLLRENNLSKEQTREYTDIIESESERLSMLSSKLLTLSELNSSSITEQAVEFRLDEQIRKTILILQPLWEEKEIEFDIEMENVKITSDEHLLQEVWLNLIQNAIKFSNPKGIIKINTTTNDGNVKVSIQDYGVGIPDKDKDYIFEKFYKTDKSRSKEGNGLGLVIVKKIVEISRGKIYFQSKEGEGSIFTVELPIRIFRISLR